jgi:hypothetical protein
MREDARRIFEGVQRRVLVHFLLYGEPFSNLGEGKNVVSNETGFFP